MRLGRAVPLRHLGKRLVAPCVLVWAVVVIPGGIAAAQIGDQPTAPTGSDSPTISTITTMDPCTQLGGGAICGTRAIGGTGESSSTSLPFAGGDVALLTVLGLACAGAGVAIVLLSRRSRTRA